MVHGGDAGEALILGVQSPRDRAEPGHDSLDSRGVAKGAAEQAFDLATLAHDEAFVAPCDERGAAKQQPITGRAGQPKIIFAGSAEPPELDCHGLSHSR